MNRQKNFRFTQNQISAIVPRLELEWVHKTQTSGITTIACRLKQRDRHRESRRSKFGIAQLLIGYAWCTNGSFSLPTQQQLVASAFLCQLLSNLYQPIQVFRYDQKLKTLYIQAGATDEVALIIDVEGIWDFVL